MATMTTSSTTVKPCSRRRCSPCSVPGPMGLFATEKICEDNRFIIYRTLCYDLNNESLHYLVTVCGDIQQILCHQEGMHVSDQVSREFFVGKPGGRANIITCFCRYHAGRELSRDCEVGSAPGEMKQRRLESISWCTPLLMGSSVCNPCKKICKYKIFLYSYLLSSAGNYGSPLPPQ